MMKKLLKITEIAMFAEKPVVSKLLKRDRIFRRGMFCRGTLYRRTVRSRNPCLQNSEQTIVKYVIEANLLRLRSTNPKKNSHTLDAFEKKRFFEEKKYAKMFKHF